MVHEMSLRSYCFGIVMVSTIRSSVSRRSDTALIPLSWILARLWVRLFRNAPTLAFPAVSRGARNEILTKSLEFALNHMEIVMKEREET